MASIYERIVELYGTDNGAEIGRQAEVERQSVYRWRDNISEPSRDTINTIVNKTGVSLTWLLTGEGEKFPSNRSVSEQSFSVERELLSRHRLVLSVQPLRVVPVVAELENSQIVSREGKTMSVPQNVSSETALTIEVLDDSWQPEGFNRGDVLVVERASGDCHGKLVVAIANGQPLIRHFERTGKMACFSALYDQQPLIRIPMNNVDIQFVVNSIWTKPI